MKTKLKNKLVRLCAMNIPEIFYRTKSMASTRLEKKAGQRKTFQEELREFAQRNRLNGSNGKHYSDDFIDHAMLDDFRNRDDFHWQMTDLEVFCELFENEFPNHRYETRLAADLIVQHYFRIFDQFVQFDAEIDWHRDLLTGQSIPLAFWADLDYRNREIVQDVKYIWELNRHQHFITLAKAYLLTGEEKYAQELFSQWQHWMLKNPYHFGINWTSSLEMTFRLISWTWALQMAKKSSILDAELYLLILYMVENHAKHIFNHLSRYSSGNNHLIGEAVGLIYAGCYYPELADSIKWQKRGFDLIFHEIPAQTFNDGVTREQAIHYQKYLFDFGVLAWIAANQFNITIPVEFDLALQRIAEFIFSLVDSNGNVPLIGDEDGGQALHISDVAIKPYLSLLATAAVLFERPDFKAVAGSFDESSFWKIGITGFNTYRSLAKVTLKKRLVHFPEGGYIIYNNPSEPNQQVLVFDYGPLGFGPLAAHGHADALSFTLSCNGQPVFIDSGTYRYQCEGNWRQHFRGTSAHNTIVVDGLDQSEQLDTFQWGRKANATLERIDETNNSFKITASHDGYGHICIQHRRTLEFSAPDTWIITDEIVGSETRQVFAYFHLAPCRYELMEQKTIVCRFSAMSFALSFDSPNVIKIDVQKGLENPLLGWYSWQYGQKTPAPVVVVKINGSLPHKLVSTIRKIP